MKFMETGTVAIARAVLSATRKCVETCGDNPGSVAFTYPTDYVDGMEYSCSITVCPSLGTHVVLYKVDTMVGELSLDSGDNDDERITNLFRALEEFQRYCSKCDEDLRFVKTLVSRVMVMTKTPVLPRAFLA
jgi:hypothetical protein